jgi:hypothetical protein
MENSISPRKKSIREQKIIESKKIHWNEPTLFPTFYGTEFSVGF